MAIVLTPDEMARFERWIIATVNENVVPSDEGNGDALVYNLVHRLRGDNLRYAYLPEQDEELAALHAIV